MMGCNYLVMIGVAPFSWRFGIVRNKPGKLVLSAGPFRLSVHDLGDI